MLFPSLPSVSLQARSHRRSSELPARSLSNNSAANPTSSGAGTVCDPAQHLHDCSSSLLRSLAQEGHWSLYLALEMAGPRWGTQPLTME